MALKLVRFIGGIAATALTDDAAHGLDIGKLGAGSAFRISEYGGNDVFFKITNLSDSTAVTATNGMYLKASSSILVVSEGVGGIRTVGSDLYMGTVSLDGTDGAGSDAGGAVLLNGTDSSSTNAGFRVALDTLIDSQYLSVINETASSDGAVYVEEVTQGNTV
jgi:hypothetical protein